MQPATLLLLIEEETSFRNGIQQNTIQLHQLHKSLPNTRNHPYRNPSVHSQIYSFCRKELKVSEQMRLSAFSYHYNNDVILSVA